ncbi:MAG: hypothetical protein JJT89_05000 [Nitriliruptoraceae bacterium]|nr:hypothetical protein [Nitriliruptoraceae bacterium]
MTERPGTSPSPDRSGGPLELSLDELAELAVGVDEPSTPAAPADDHAAIARTVREAIVEIEVVVHNRVATGSALALAGPDLALLAVGPPGAEVVDRHVPRRIVLRSAMGLIYSLAELLEVEARRPPPLEDPLVLPVGICQDLLAATSDQATALVDQLVDVGGSSIAQLEALQALAGHMRASWSVRSAIPVAEDRVVERHHRVVDGGDAGWWMLVGGDDVDTLSPSTGRRVLEALESLLPSDRDLHGLTDVVIPPTPATPTHDRSEA